MLSSIKLLIKIISMLAFLSSCVGDSSHNNNVSNGLSNNSQNRDRIDWGSIPSEYNPEIQDTYFSTSGIEQINLDIFGFTKDAEVVYSNELSQGQARLRIYKVWKNQVSWGSLQSTTNGKVLNISNYGTYQCSIKIVNGKIVELDGGCYVRIQLFLPAGTSAKPEIEVYNVGVLLTQSFFAMSTESFLEQLKRATWSEDKFAVIEKFLKSNSSTRKNPSLTAYELGLVIKEFIRSEDKFKALRKLHRIVSDRENLDGLIDDNFSYFDREEARNIVGIR